MKNEFTFDLSEKFYVVGDFYSEQIIISFNDLSEFESWIERNVTDGYMDNGTRVSIYEI